MMRSARTLGAALLVAVSLAALAGCSHAASSPKSNALDGTNWKLTGWTVSSLNPADFTITADFAHGQISGTSAVNSYSGPYKLGPGDAFSLGPIASTEMAGPEPAMRAESAYQKLLAGAKSYKLASGTLTLYDAGGNPSLIFASENK
jgi:heat shock protein HslJ